ncbi:MAG: hypothetical protein JST26_06255 [Bacteroidetes bacterium]|nr:hypothetical protein [Bacteroidota bacterium]
MEQTTTTSTKGKGLGIAGMVIGIVALVWSIIPLIGAAAWWLALVGLILSLVAFFMAKNGGNPSKGMMITGIILNIVALGLAIFWIYKIASAASAMVGGLENLQDSLNVHMEELKNAMDTTQMH